MTEKTSGVRISYRAFFRDLQGNIERVENIECDDDNDCIERVRAFRADRLIELWQSSRLVARLDRGGTILPA
ncbi:MAG: hypothetical protein KF794_07705 [Xanthobacteraceae bacterium]|nr:hypothetical protein [Xanthobacteraceae bacterium]QYK43701.1 MAG: hypothetical protein KF794_07705 [Xanthobacteraceae bacterium]